MGENGSLQVKVKTSWLAHAAVWCLAISIAVAIAVLASGGKGVASVLDGIPKIVLTVPFVAALLFGIAALITIARSDVALGGKGRSSATVAALTVMLGLFAVGMGVSKVAYSELCLENMKGVANAMLVYGQDNHDKLPDADRWCDLLVAKADISPSSFICKHSDARFGESSYAINIAAAGKTLSELPKDMVLVFEVVPPSDETRTYAVTSRPFATDANVSGYFMKPERAKGMVRKSQWNQACGLEDAAVTNHYGGCNILFADYHVDYVRKDKLSSLRWTLDGTPPPVPAWLAERPGSLKVVRITLWATAAVMVLWAGVLVVVCRPWRIWLILTMAALAALGSLVLGTMSGPLYFRRMVSVPGLTETLVGAVVGLWAGICYAVFLGWSAGRLKRSGNTIEYAVALGTAAGVVASTVFHVVMMVAYRDAQGGLPMVAGMPFGVVAGAVLGWIGGQFVKGGSDVGQSAHQEG